MNKFESWSLVILLAGGASLSLLAGWTDDEGTADPADGGSLSAAELTEPAPVEQAPPRSTTVEAPEAALAFLAWVAENWSAPEQVASEPECYGPDDADYGWCEGMVIAEGAVRGVKWRKANPKAVEFESGALPRRPGLSCESFSSETVRKWVWQHDSQSASAVAHCRIRDGALSGQQLWIKNAPQSTYLAVFSSEYLRFDGDFDETLRSQGRTVE